MSIARTPLILLVLAAAFGLAACGGGQKKPEYYEAQETPALDIPDGLDSPDADVALVINSPAMPPPSMVMETKPPRITSTTSGINANSRLRWSSQGLYLTVDDSAESAHRRLGLVIERAGMERIRLDDQGVYRFDYYQVFDEEGFLKKMAFWSRNKAEDYSGAYQVFTQPDGQQTRVYIKYADGSDCEPDAAEHLLDVIRSRLG